MNWDNTEGRDHPDLELPPPALNPQASELIEADHPRLLEPIRLLVGHYCQRQFDSGLSDPTPSQLRDAAKRAANHAAELRKELAKLPSGVCQYANERAFDEWRVTDLLGKRTQTALQQIAELMLLLSKSAGAEKASTGPKSKQAEHCLLSDVAELFEKEGMGHGKAAKLAAEILTHACVHGLPTVEARRTVIDIRKSNQIE